jgi:hypothetical protein
MEIKYSPHNPCCDFGCASCEVAVKYPYIQLNRTTNQLEVVMVTKGYANWYKLEPAV